LPIAVAIASPAAPTETISARWDHAGRAFCTVIAEE
jgi:hypothetical protein